MVESIGLIEPLLGSLVRYLDFASNTRVFETHLGWFGCIDLKLGSVLLLEVSYLSFSGANLSGLI